MWILLLKLTLSAECLRFYISKNNFIINRGSCHRNGVIQFPATVILDFGWSRIIKFSQQYMTLVESGWCEQSHSGCITPQLQRKGWLGNRNLRLWTASAWPVSLSEAGNPDSSCGFFSSHVRYEIQNREQNTHIHTHTTGERRKGNFVTLKYFIVQTFWSDLISVGVSSQNCSCWGNPRLFTTPEGEPVSFIPCPPVRYSSLTLVEYWTQTFPQSYFSPAHFSC